MFYSVIDPHRTFSNSIVKGYSGDDTKRVAFWENNTMSKLVKKIAFNAKSKKKYMNPIIMNNEVLKISRG